MRLLFASVALFSLVSAPAFAHIQLDYPTARTTQQKTGPCGAPGSVRGTNVTELQAGEVITITWRETINHPGHYRISFDADGQDDFGDPASFTDFYSNPAVLVDEIGDKQGGMYTYDLTVPGVACDNCTLQVVQVMTDKAPYGDGNDLYYQCADIVIVKSGVTPDAGEADMGSDLGEADMGTEPTNNTTNNANNGSNNTNQTSNNATNNGTNNTTGTTNDTSSSSDEGCSSVNAASEPLLLVLGLLGFGWMRRRR